MIDGKKLITAVVGALVVTAAVRADMVPVSRLDAGHGAPARVSSRTDLPHANSSSQFDYSGLADLGLWHVEVLPEAVTDVTQTAQIQHLQTLTNGPSSLSLCLSALIGLALCNSGHWVKRISFGFVPEWFHNGGPFQIGHSYAVTPESLYPVPVCCFIQPNWAAEHLIPQYRLRTVVSLWRKSQFTPSALASRGPPVLS